MGNPVLWTTATAITAVRNTIQDPTGAASQRWTDAEIVGYLNRALQSIVADAEVTVETSWLADLTDGDREYQLPSNFVKDKVVEFNKAADDVRRLTYVDRESWESSGFSKDPTKTGIPTHYSHWARKGDDPTTYQPGSIYLYPAPDSDSEGAGKLRIWGYKVPDALDDGDDTKTIELDPVYIEAMLQYASALAMLDDGDHGRHTKMMGHYSKAIADILDLKAKKSRSNFGGIPPRDSSLTVWPRWDKPWRRPWGVR